MADLFIIGQFDGVEGTTAVSIGSQVMHMLTVMIVGMAMGSTVIIGKAIGAQKKEEASTAIGNTLSQTISVIVSLWIILRKQTGITLKKQDFLHCNYYYC